MTKPTFKLPSIFGAKKPLLPLGNAASSLPTAPVILNKFSDSANAHLPTARLGTDPTATSPLRSNSINIMPTANRSKFTVPKLNGYSPLGSSPTVGSGEQLTPHEISLQKIMELRRLKISGDGSPNSGGSGGSDDERIRTTYAKCDPDMSGSSSVPSTAVLPVAVDEQSFAVDLTCALNKPGTVNSVVAPVKRVAEPINFKFVDCDIIERPSARPIVTKDCRLDISGILADVIGCRTKQTSTFGRILCSRYTRRVKPYVVHGFDNKHQIEPFGFEIIDTATKKR